MRWRDSSEEEGARRVRSRAHLHRIFILIVSLLGVVSCPEGFHHWFSQQFPVRVARIFRPPIFDIATDVPRHSSLTSMDASNCRTEQGWESAISLGVTRETISHHIAEESVGSAV